MFKGEEGEIAEEGMTLYYSYYISLQSLYLVSCEDTWIDLCILWIVRTDWMDLCIQ